jgi:enoyl-CoA hydratase
MAELVELVERWDADPELRSIVIAGGDDWFAAGADIKSMAERTFADTLTSPAARFWSRLAAVRTPLIAAVSGYALGGGCELAMSCDLLVAGDDAVFGQPEIRLGVMPGAGGTQRLTRAIGRARAMDMVLTGRTMDAAEAHAAGLVTSVVPAATTVDAALDLAERIAAMPPLAVRAAKRAVRGAEELPLSEGLAAERRAFFDLFATADQREGMQAFMAKRPPVWTGR